MHICTHISLYIDYEEESYGAAIGFNEGGYFESYKLIYIYMHTYTHMYIYIYYEEKNFGALGSSAFNEGG